MTKHTFSLAVAAAALGGLALSAAGCFGSDPNMNSYIYNKNPGSDAAPASGAGGGGGSGGVDPNGPIIGVPLATFDTANQGFSFSTYSEMPNLAVNNGGTPPSIMWDGTDGSPTSGSLKVFAPYSGANQYVDIQSKAFATTSLQNWAHGTLHVRVKVSSGTFNGQIEPYVDTTTNYAFVGASLNPAKGGGWQDLSVDLDNAMTQISGYDLTQVILFGVHIGSGTAGSSQQPVTFNIDSFSIAGVPGLVADAGADTGTPAGSDAAATSDAPAAD